MIWISSQYKKDKANHPTNTGKGLGSLGSGVMGGLSGKGNKKDDAQAQEEGESDSDRQNNSGFF